jgi:hypothetical protein
VDRAGGDDHLARSERRTRAAARDLDAGDPRCRRRR